MNKVTLPIATAAMRLRAPEFEPFLEHLRSVRSAAQEALCDVTDELQVRRLQGRAKLAKELLELVEGSSDLVAKFNQASR